jgi:catechol 2,3-dioxygenase-like lactoylglutathione lyase family enzyme
MELQHIDHIGLNVRDLATSFKFYRAVFGFDIVHKWTTTWMVGKDAIRLGLFQRPKAIPVCNIDQALSITHVAFRVSGEAFELAQTELKDLGVSFDPPEDTGIAFSIFVLDPDGHQIELTTYDRPKTGDAS